MRVLVTGGAGAIGSHVVDTLLSRGDEAAVLDAYHDFYPRPIKEANLRAAREHSSFLGVFEGDIRDRAFVRKTLEQLRPEAVIHLAARAGVRPSVVDPVDYSDVNLTGTAVVAHEAIEVGVERLVFASSSTVYGRDAESPFRESAETAQPLSPYGASKRGGELLCYSLHLASSLPITCLRFFSAYGPRQRPDLAIAHWAIAMREGRPIPVFGDGSVERDFTYISDIVDGVLRALDRASGFAIYNLGRGQPFSMNRIITLLEAELGVTAKRDVHPPHPADMPRTYASIDLARAELGYDPKVELADGIREYVAWLRATPEALHA